MCEYKFSIVSRLPLFICYHVHFAKARILNSWCVCPDNQGHDWQPLRDNGKTAFQICAGFAQCRCSLGHCRRFSRILQKWVEHLPRSNYNWNVFGATSNLNWHCWNLKKKNRKFTVQIYARIEKYGYFSDKV